MVAYLTGAIVWITAGTASAEGPLKLAGGQLEPVKWSELAGWTADDHLAAFAAYRNSCDALRRLRRTDDRGQISRALQNVCRKAIGRLQDAHTARDFFEQNFQPVRIARLGESEGLLTGYFEPIVAGSRFPSPEFPVPLYRRPGDLVAAGYKQGSLAFPNKGVIGRRNANNELVPYHDRGAIEAGALDGRKLEICWLKDPFDLLAIQLEGSGRVILEDGTPLRVSFDSHNGYSFSSIERVLRERNLIPHREISPQRIRKWMAAHPDEAAKVRAGNRSYVFFRVTGLSNDGQPVGAQGVPLTPGRSIAVDRVHEYGTPFFIEANLPIESGKRVSPFRRLMIAQDTGSAIVGPARADLYWGAGDEAGRIAGRIRHPGRFVMLLPREVDLVEAGRQMPLPAPKPKFASTEVAKQDDKSKNETAGTGAVVAARKGPSSLSNTKITALDPGKQSRNSEAHSANALSIATARKKLPRAPTTTAIEVVKENAKRNTGATDAGMSAAGKSVVLPVPKPKNSVTEVKKQHRGKTEPVGTSGSGKPSPVSMKSSDLEAGNQDARGKTNSAAVGAEIPGSRQGPSQPTNSKARRTEANKHAGKPRPPMPAATGQLGGGS